MDIKGGERVEGEEEGDNEKWGICKRVPSIVIIVSLLKSHLFRIGYCRFREKVRGEFALRFKYKYIYNVHIILDIKLLSILMQYFII